MADLAFVTDHFWIFCGILVGLGGAAFLRFKLKRYVLAGQLDASAVQRFTLGWAIAILAPCAILRLLALSAAATSPDYLTWEQPQKWIALALNVACWVALLAWVWLGPGAATLSSFLAPAFSAGLLRSHNAVRAISAFMVLAGVASLAMRFGQ